MVTAVYFYIEVGEGDFSNTGYHNVSCMYICNLMLYDKWNCQHDSECVQVRPNRSVLCVLLQFHVLHAELACCQYWQVPPYRVFLHIIVYRMDREVVRVITLLLLFRDVFS